MIVPEVPLFAESAVTRHPTIWYGTTIPNAAAIPWLQAPVGSIYVRVAGTRTVTYQKSTANSLTGDWIIQNGNSDTWLNAKRMGAVGDRNNNLLSGRYSSREAAEAAYPYLFDGSRFVTEWDYFTSTYGFDWDTDWGDATADWAGIQSGLVKLLIRNGSYAGDAYDRGAGLVIPAGTYKISLPLVVRTGMKMVGAGAYFEDDNWPSTLISLVTNSNTPGLIDRGVIDTEYWHAGEIRNICFEGDRNTTTAALNSTTGSGLVISRMGETTTLDAVQAIHWAEHGIRITNIPTPGNLGRLSCFRNYISGLNVEMGSGGQLQVEHLSGDNNGEALLKCGNSYKSTLLIGSIKSERSNTSGTAFRGNTDVVLLDSTNGLTCNVGAMWVEASDLANPGNSLFKITGTSGYVTVYGNIVVRDGQETGYSKGIDNVFAGTSQTITAVNNIGPWSTRTAAWSIF